MAFYLRASRQHPFVPNQVFEESDLNDRGHSSRESGNSLLTPLSSDRENVSVDNDEQWTVFSPHMTEVTSGVESEIGDIQLLDEEQRLESLLDPIQDSEGTSTPLAFPSHNGTGSFLWAGSELADRVNAWRLDQSQLVIQELQRLEQKFFWSPGGVGDHDSRNIVHDITADKKKPQGSIWDRFVQDVMGFNDQVLEMLFGDRYFEESQQEDCNQESFQQDTTSHRQDGTAGVNADSTFVHYNQAVDMGPPGWQDRIIFTVLDRLNIPAGTDVKFLRYVGSRILELTRPHNNSASQPFYPKLRDVPTFAPPNNYWDDSLVSSNWEQSSISTPVW